MKHSKSGEGFAQTSRQENVIDETGGANVVENAHIDNVIHKAERGNTRADVYL
jgi:hypothetical protein